MTERRALKRAFRLAVFGIAGAWCYSVQKGWSVLFGTSSEVELETWFFPAVSDSFSLFLVAMVVPPAVGLVAFVRPTPRTLRVFGWVTAIAAAFLVLNPRTIGYQVFVTSFWTALWICFAASAWKRDDDARFRTSVALAALVLTVVFAGAAVGKLTSGYWNGEVLYHLMFLYQTVPKFELLRDSVDREGLRALAILYSRAVVVSELALVLVPWLLKVRYAFVLWILGLFGMWLTTGIGIIEAIGPLIGLAFAALVLSSAPSTDSATVDGGD